MRLEERDGLQKDIRLCDVPLEYFGISHPKPYPFIVTIAEQHLPKAL